jgi:hypothetical protein
MIEYSPKRFPAWFNEKYPGVFRSVSVQDIKDLITCNLICRPGYLLTTQDGETIRGLLEYEQLREKRSKQNPVENTLLPPVCKICGSPLPIKTVGEVGRPKEYCSDCDAFRNRERQRYFSANKRKQSNKPLLTENNKNL